MKELLNIKDLAEMLSMGTKGARDFCSRHGVQPINVGQGKRSSLRWSRSRVMELIDTMQADKPTTRLHPSSRRSVSGMTDRQIIEKLAVPVVQ